MTRAGNIRDFQDGKAPKGPSMAELQAHNAQLAHALSVRAATLFGEMLDAVTIRKSQAIAGDLTARREIQSFLIAINPESLKAAAMGIQTPGRDPV